MDNLIVIGSSGHAKVVIDILEQQGRHRIVGLVNEDGAVLTHGVTVGEHSVVGGGATVLRDVAARKVAFGESAREVHDRAPGDRYL